MRFRLLPFFLSLLLTVESLEFDAALSLLHQTFTQPLKRR
jgi:hypothetical protein